jgi:hypothetical protein
VKLGALLPTFRDNAEDALAFADDAARAGLDGVFAFDHLWPMGSPERPALAPFPMLAAVAARQPSLSVGPLVARVGMFGTPKLLEQFTTLDALAPGRVIAALGTGDKLSEPEIVGYGLTHGSSEVRRALLEETMTQLPRGMEIWCGAGAPATDALARRLGVTLNLWGVPAERVREAALDGPVSWAGPLGADPHALLEELAAAGATWAVASAPVDLGALDEWRRGH